MFRKEMTVFNITIVNNMTYTKNYNGSMMVKTYLNCVRSQKKEKKTENQIIDIMYH